MDEIMSKETARDLFIFISVYGLVLVLWGLLQLVHFLFDI